MTCRAKRVRLLTHLLVCAVQKSGWLEVHLGHTDHFQPFQAHVSLLNYFLLLFVICWAGFKFMK